MADLIFVAVIIGFIALCVAYIGWCDRIIGPDDPPADVTPQPLENVLDEVMS